MSSELTVYKGGSLFYNYVPKKQHSEFVKLQCFSELYSKNVVNTFFLNQYHPWVTTLSLKMLASCENSATFQDISL